MEEVGEINGKSLFIDGCMDVREFMTNNKGTGKDVFLKENPNPFLVIGGSLNTDGDEKTFKTTTIPTDCSMMDEKLIEIKKREDANMYSFITLGRASNNDIVIHNGTISKLHSVFGRKGEHFTLADSGSSNGTSVNGNRLPANKPIVLKNGDVITWSSSIFASFLTPIGVFAMLKDQDWLDRNITT